MGPLRRPAPPIAGGGGGAAAAAPAAKRPRQVSAPAPPPPQPEELEEGTPVLYSGGRRAFIRDAYAPLDEFWLTDAETGQIVRDETGEIVQFKSADLQLIPQPAAAEREEVAGCQSGVLLLGGMHHMVRILEHFGPANPDERCSPQQLLAITCSTCDAVQISTAAEGIAEEVTALAQRLRPDLHVGVRALQLRQAMERAGQDLLRREDLYVLASVQLPYSMEAVEEPGLSNWERHRRLEVCNQIDICVTACREHSAEESPEVAARLALGESCGIELSDVLWDGEVQQALRRRLGVDVARQFEDAAGAQISVVLLPDDAVASKIHGVLCFSEAPGVDYTAEPRVRRAPGAAGREAAHQHSPEEAAMRAAARGRPVEQQIHGKTVREWEAEQQALFPGLPKLAPGWLRIRSRKSNDVYYFNKKTREATFELPEAPLPPGWTQQVSKSTGKTYYFHPQRKVSTFDRPTA